MDLALGLQSLTTSTVSIPNMGLMVRKDQAVFSYLREGPLPPKKLLSSNTSSWFNQFQVRRGRASLEEAARPLNRFRWKNIRKQQNLKFNWTGRQKIFDVKKSSVEAPQLLPIADRLTSGVPLRHKKVFDASSKSESAVSPKKQWCRISCYHLLKVYIII